MSIYKTADSPNWKISIYRPGGKRIRRSTGTPNRKQAQEYHDKLVASLWDQDRLGARPAYSFEHAALRMLHISEGQADYKVKLRHVEYWNRIFAGRAIGSLTSDEVFANLPTHWKPSNRKNTKGRLIKNATRNRYLSTIRRILSIAEQLNWIIKAPKLPAFEEQKVHIRWITKPDAALLLENISLQWLREVSQFALATGARANEIFSLTWDKVDLNRSMAWVTQDLSKSGKSRPMPLNAEALSLLEVRKDAGTEYCFTRPSGRQITQIDRRCFERAVKAAGLKKLKFHDLRHTWASWHVQSGTPLMILKELGGWETIEMVQKYAHLDVGHLAQYVTASQIQSRFSHGGESENKKAA